MALLPLLLVSGLLQSPSDGIVRLLEGWHYKRDASAPVRMPIRFYKERPTSGFGGGQAPSSGSQTVGPMVRDWVQVWVTKQGKPVWEDLANASRLQSVCLGERDGWRTYVYLPYMEAVYTLKTSTLKGADSWRDLALKGLTIKDKRDSIDSGCASFFANEGDAAVPALLKALEGRPDSAWPIVIAIANTRGPRSTKELRRLYASPDKRLSDPAAYALIAEPLRPEAKPEYLSMLAKGKYLIYLAPAVAKRGWKEAIPPLEKAIAAPLNAHALVEALESHRVLTSRPIPPEIKRAFSNLMSFEPVEVEASLATLRGYEDIEVVAAYAYLLSDWYTKGDTAAARKAGEELAAQLPSDVMESVRKRLKKS